MDFSKEFFRYLVGAMVGLGGGGLILYLLLPKPIPKNATKTTTYATAFSKAMNNGYYGSAYYIAFVLSNGRRKNIKVNIEQYNTIGEGEKGLLTYKEHKGKVWFVSFSPDSSD